MPIALTPHGHRSAYRTAHRTKTEPQIYAPNEARAHVNLTCAPERIDGAKHADQRLMALTVARRATGWYLSPDGRFALVTHNGLIVIDQVDDSTWMVRWAPADRFVHWSFTATAATLAHVGSRLRQIPRLDRNPLE